MYEQGTPHYNLPQTKGTDKRDWLDTNQAFADIDATLYTASETASSTASTLSDLSQTVAGIQGDVTDIQQDVADIDGRVTQQGSAITGLTTRVDDVKADALDMICAVDEGTAQVATVPVNEGDYFRYNDVLYMADRDIAIGDTIVPNTNCHATNVATELQNISPSGEVVDETARQEIGNLSNLQTTSKTDLVSAINEVLSQIGGNGMELKEYGTGTIASSASDATVTFTDYQPEDLNYVVILNSGIVGHPQSGGYAGGGGVYLKAKTLTGFTVSCEPETIGSNATGHFSYQVLH